MTVYIHRQGMGEPLLLLHGWGFNHQIWGSWASLLASQYQVYLVDLPGFGATPNMNWEYFKASLLNQLPERVVLIGWSLGGLIAMRLALEEASRVSRVIHIASTPRFVREAHWPGVDDHTFQLFYEQLQTHPKLTLERFVALQVQNSSCLLHALTPFPDCLALQKSLLWLRHWDFRNDLVSFDKPMLYVFGRADRIIPRQTMSVMQQQYPQFQYEMLSAAHAPFLSHPEVMKHLVERFLS